MSNSVKILVVGPPESGKTYLANFLADATDISSGTYRPTKGVRILEFEVNGVRTKTGVADVAIELWDCSGDQKYEICWPSMQKNTDGIVFVFDPTIETQKKELENWYLHFAKGKGVTVEQCIVFARHKSGSTEKATLGGTLNDVKLINSNVDDDPDSTHKHFQSFLRNVVIYSNARREKEELSIIQ